MKYWALWGKTRQAEVEGDETHALIHHMIDVGAVATVLWENVVAEASRGDLCQLLGINCDEAGALLSWLASLHDIGKASPAFQVKYTAAYSSLTAAGFSLGMLGSKPTHHSLISQHVLLKELPQILSAPTGLIFGLATVIGGHHGTWQGSDIPYWDLGDQTWGAVRHELVGVLHGLFQPPVPRQWPSQQTEINTFLTMLAGLITTADWLGSMADCFPCEKGPMDLNIYRDRAGQRAERAVKTFFPHRLPAENAKDLFLRLFPGFTPNPVQQAAIELASRLVGPSLVIIEAPTGCGKTEAALYLAERLRCKQAGSGTYVAMPTITTSNQMYERVERALTALRPASPLRPLLVHGQSLWQAPPPSLSVDQEAGPSTESLEWFLPRKRALLAPYAVGTVDQTLLSVLPTKHFYMRLYGLAHKTIVFDEVHAYDTYMSTLFERLLRWLHALGASAIILSATLPSATRQRLLDTYGPAEEAGTMDTPYPAISWKSQGHAGVLPLPRESVSKEYRLRWLTEEDIVDDLRAALADGGCAAVICNTVARAQTMYLAAKEAALVPAEDLHLFHAHYPRSWRDRIERQVLDRFGKERQRMASERALLVATQVIEQSLDHDFDYMISDLAPIDLLIQRAGRLHRHPRGPDQRPARLSLPTLTIIQPEAVDGVPQFKRRRSIYEPYVLLRTALVLENCQTLRTPDDTSSLIEAVYDDSCEPDLASRPGFRAALAQARSEMVQAMRAAIYEAKRRLIAAPDSRSFITGQSDTFVEEDVSVHRALQALTRLTEPSVQLVCLHRRSGQLFSDVDGGVPVCLDTLDDGIARVLVQSSVLVSHQGAVWDLLAQEPPKTWARHPFLRYCRVAVFVDGVCSLPNSHYTFHLSPELGLQVSKEE